MQTKLERGNATVLKTIAKKEEQKTQNENTAITEKTEEQKSIIKENESFQDESARYLETKYNGAATNYQFSPKNENPNKKDPIETRSYGTGAFTNLGLRKEVSEIKIYNLAGKLIGEYKPAKTDGYEITLDKNISNGVYLLNFEFKDKSPSITKKIFKISGVEQKYPIKLNRIFPRVTSGIFRNSGTFSDDNKAAPKMGLGLLNTAADGVHYVCEMKFNFDMEGYDFSEYDINVKRSRTNTLDYFDGVKWKSDPLGTATGKDDTSPSGNISLVKDYKNPHIYDYDGPGLQPYHISIARFEDTLKAKEVIYAANFVQWVQFKEKATGTIINDSVKLNWFCKIRFKQKSLHSWELVSDESVSGTGKTTLGH
jgi:hypothetical protein